MIIQIDRGCQKLAEGFDLLKFLEDKDIRHKRGGENIGSGWVGVETCPFCQKDKFHFGIHIQSCRASCWVCGSRVSAKNLHFLIHKIADCSISQAKSWILEYQSDTASISKEVLLNYATHSSLPQHLFEDPPPKMLSYIESRGFPNPDVLVAKYGLKFSKPHSNRPNSIVFPYFYSGELITYITRPIIGKGYRTAPIKDSIMDAKRSLYNIDNCKPQAPLLVVEGPFDVLKVGAAAQTTDQVCGTGGIQWTYEQVLSIITKQPSHVYVCFDSLEEAAQRQAEKLVNTLLYLSIPASRIELSQTEPLDPGGLSLQEAKKLRRMIQI
jgi:hypothetical protein